MLPQSPWLCAGWEAEGHLEPQTAPSHWRPGWGEACLCKEAKWTIQCRSVAVSRAPVWRSRGRKGRGAASLPSRRALPQAAQPQTRTCMHQTRTRPLHRAELSRDRALLLASCCLHPQQHNCTAHGGQEGLRTELCPLPRGIPGPQYLLLLTLRSSWGGVFGRASSPAAPAQVESRPCCFRALIEPLIPASLYPWEG